MSSQPFISVIIPVRNEAKFIAKTIEYLQNQEYPEYRMEIIVVDGQSDDETCTIVKSIAASDPRVRLFDNPKRLSSAARNIGAHKARGEIILYVDGHTYIDNAHLLLHTAKLMEENEVSVLSRPQFLETPDNNRFQRAVALARRSPVGHGLDSTIYESRELYVNPASSGAAYKKEVFVKVGGFDERYDAAEDYEFNYRVGQAGYRSFTSLKLAVYYYPRKTIAALFKQMGRYGTGRMRLAVKHPDTFGLGTLVPVLLTFGLLLLPFLSLLPEKLCLAYGGLYGLYLAMILLSSLLISLKRGIGYLAYLPLIFPTIHFGLGYGFIREFVRTALGRGLQQDPAT